MEGKILSTQLFKTTSGNCPYFLQVPQDSLYQVKPPNTAYKEATQAGNCRGRAYNEYLWFGITFSELFPLHNLSALSGHPVRTEK